MTVKLLTEHYWKFVSLKCCRKGSSEPTLVKIPHCRESHVAATYEPVYCQTNKLNYATSRDSNQLVLQTIRLFVGYKVSWSSNFNWLFKGGASFVDPSCYLCFTFVLYNPCSLVITCWETADLLSLFCVVWVMVNRVGCGTRSYRFLVVAFVFKCFSSCWLSLFDGRKDNFVRFVCTGSLKTSVPL